MLWDYTYFLVLLGALLCLLASLASTLLQLLRLVLLSRGRQRRN